MSERKEAAPREGAPKEAANSSAADPTLSAESGGMLLKTGKEARKKKGVSKNGVISGSSKPPLLNLSNEAWSTLVGVVSCCCAFLALLLLFAWASIVRPLPREICHLRCDCAEDCNLCRRGNLSIVCLRPNSHYRQGVHYGKALKDVLLPASDRLIRSSDDSYSLVSRATAAFRLLPLSSRLFLDGVAEGGDLPASRVHLLNFAPSLQRHSALNASTLAFAAHAGPIGQPLSGYALATSEGEASRPLLTVLHSRDALPTAFLAFPGQVSATLALNSEGVFAALASGHRSGSSAQQPSRSPLDSRLVDAVRTSFSTQDLRSQLSGWSVDEAASVTLSDKTEGSARVLEFSLEDGQSKQQSFRPTPPQALVVGEHFQAPGWGAETTASPESLRRVEGLRRVLRRPANVDMALLRRELGRGALEAALIFKPLDMSLRLSLGRGKWHKVDLKPFFTYDIDPERSHLLRRYV